MAITVLKTVRSYVQKCLAVSWRAAASKELNKIYFTNLRFYNINILGESSPHVKPRNHLEMLFPGNHVTSHSLDNPDQRLVSDLHLLCSSYGVVVADLILAPVAIGYYWYDAYNRAGWIGPTGMVGIFLVSAIINKVGGVITVDLAFSLKFCFAVVDQPCCCCCCQTGSL